MCQHTIHHVIRVIEVDFHSEVGALARIIMLYMVQG